MMNLKDKEIRLQLIAKYIEAETTVAEEAQLYAYYAANEADEDELAIAQMIRMEHANEALLSKEGAEEFDRIVNQTKPKQSNSIRYLCDDATYSFVWDATNISKCGTKRTYHLRAVKKVKVRK